MASLHVGLDLDNTIINYDRAFADVGAAMGLLPVDKDWRSKEAIKNYLLARGQGEADWMRLQGQIYGRHIGRAQLSDGVAAFLRRMREERVWLSIVSHKTKYGHFDSDRVNLWDAARGWLEAHGFFSDAGFGLRADDIHFCETRDGKIATIGRIECDFFVDDLPEVLLDSRFPKTTVGIWYTTEQAAGEVRGLKPHRGWDDVHNAIVSAAGTAHGRPV